MNPKVFLCVVLSFSALTTIAKKEKLRTWTSTSGKTVEASFAGIEDGKVQLRSAEGKMGAIPLANLISADQQYARKRGGGGRMLERTESQLAGFASGEWKQCNTVYRGEDYIAKLLVAGNLQIQPLEDGKPVGAPFQVLVWRYTVNRKGAHGARTVRVKLKALTEGPEPGMHRGQQALVVRGTFEDDCTFTLSLDLTPDDISFALEHEPASRDENAFTQLRLRIPKTFAAGSAELAQIKQATDGWLMTIKGKDIRQEQLPFWKAARSESGLESASLKGPWGERRIDVEFTPYKGAAGKVYGSFHIYAQRALHDGGSLRMTLQEKRDQAKMDVLIK